MIVSGDKHGCNRNLDDLVEAPALMEIPADPEKALVWPRLLCRECGINELRLPLGAKVINPACFTCRVCNGNKSILDNMSKEDIAKMPFDRDLARERGRQREGFIAYKRRVERDRKFRKRNGFTLDEWHKRVDTLGWVCSSCGCGLTKELGKENTVVRWSTDGSKSLDKTFPVCRACQCKKIGPLGAPR